jgi:ATP synthase protein I
MSRTPEGEGHNKREEFLKRIEEEEKRKIISRQRKAHGIWFGLGMIGTVGWSISVPILVGLALGIWLDSNWPGRVPWTLTLLLVGLVLGLLNAWYWVMRELRAIEQEREARKHE